MTTVTTKLAIPTIHLNGTSREALSDQLCEAHFELGKAVKALCRAAPNARDYYVQDAKTFEAAFDQHEARVKRLTDVMREIEEIAEAIAF